MALWCVSSGAQQGGSTSTSSSASLPAAPSAVARTLRLPGGFAVASEQPAAMRLTLDQAVQLGLKDNTELIVRAQQEKFVRGQILTVANSLLPNLEATAYSNAQEINLAARGFNPSTVHPAGFSGSIPTIVKVNVTSAQLSLTQQLTVPAYFLFRAAQKSAQASNWATLGARGVVVQTVGGLYLRTLADEAELANADALIKQDEVVYQHAKASKDAGVGISLDVLRAQVQLQSEQQAAVRAENAVGKDKIQLNRAMGQPAGQALDLVDTVPFADFEVMSIEEATRIASEKRKDLRGLEAQLEVAAKATQAVKYERLPTLGVGGFYGLIGETTGLYHGNFVAQGQLQIPIFQEATLRGQREVAQGQQIGLHHQIAGLKNQIEAEIRSSILDVQSAAELVKVARSNVGLATEALGDATERFTAGVDDNLPVVRAQATLVGAQDRVVQAEFQYNYAKLTLARNTGVLETQYRRYLGQ